MKQIYQADGPGLSGSPVYYASTNGTIKSFSWISCFTVRGGANAQIRLARHWQFARAAEAA